MYKISIITPTYNHEKFISSCLKSVLNQTYKNWEMIIIDDASTDKTYKIALNFARQDRRIKILHHKSNWGIKRLKDSYNQALKLAKGELIAILEGDDFWPEDKLLNQVNVFWKDNTSVLSYGNWEFVDSKGNRIYTRKYGFDKNKLANMPLYSIFDLFLTLHFDIASSTVLIKKNALQKIGGFKKDEYYPFIDIPTFMELAKIGSFTYLDEVLGFYRRTQQSSWINFAQKSNSMGREEMRNSINNFTKSKISKKLVSEIIIFNQNRYLKFRKYTQWLSIIFNNMTS